MSLKQQLSDIDLQLELMPAKNRKMLYASIFIGLVMFSYYIFGLDLQTEYETKLETLSSLEAKLADNKVNVYKDKIKKSEEKILFLSEKHQKELYKAQFLRTKLEGMEYLSSDAIGLANILERILKHSVILGIKIDKISLDDSVQEYKAQIQKRGNIFIEGVANFSSVLKLLRFIEDQEALMEIENIHFDLDDKSATPSFRIMITGYGISL